MELARDGAVYVLDLGAGENRIDGEFLDAFAACLDRVEASDPPRALVTTGSGRFYSNGLDLEAFADETPPRRAEFLGRFERLLGRLLVAPFVTVAAIVGHCYAGGALLALAHDLRVMRADRGFFCLPSVDVGIPFTPAMTRLVTAKIPPPVSQVLVVTADRIGGEEAARTGVVSEALPAAEVVPRAVELAAAAADKDPETLATVKRRLYDPVVSRI
ncbi:MAG TPA: enoyl-CoA hydratase/isomerase family protein [Actinobacteria bacterium]|nr:enoyl-CoA hydratase/isomerase family protein [Actinomycetota bacterium]